MRRYEAVDTLRGLCIVLVVLHHTNLRLNFDRSPTGMHVPNEIASDYAYFANLDGIALGCLAAVLSWWWRISRPDSFAARTVGWAFLVLIVFFRHVTSWIGISRARLDVSFRNSVRY